MASAGAIAGGCARTSLGFDDTQDGPHDLRVTSAQCVFCRIAEQGAAPELVIRRDSMVVFLDHRPVFAGHCLVAPTAHVSTWAELPEAQLGPMLSLARRVGAALEHVVGAEGAFFGLNDRVSQSVPHVHMHVIPRRKGDGLHGFFWPRQRYGSDEEAARLASLLRQAIGW